MCLLSSVPDKLYQTGTSRPPSQHRLLPSKFLLARRTLVVFYNIDVIYWTGPVLWETLNLNLVSNIKPHTRHQSSHNTKSDSEWISPITRHIIRVRVGLAA